MSEEKLGLARLCRSFELASLEKGYVKKALDAYENLVTVLYCNEVFDPNHPDTFFEKV